MIDGQFVGNARQRLVEQPVLVERADEVLAYGSLLIAEGPVMELPHEVIIERGHVGILHGLLLGTLWQGAELVVGDVVLAAIVAHDELLAAFGAAVMFSTGKLGRSFGCRCLECGIVDDLAAHALFHLYGGELDEARHQHLQGRQSLRLHHLLALYLYL